MARKKKRKPVRIAHELSRTRRKAIEKALQEHQIEDRSNGIEIRSGAITDSIGNL